MARKKKSAKKKIKKTKKTVRKARAATAKRKTKKTRSASTKRGSAKRSKKTKRAAKAKPVAKRKAAAKRKPAAKRKKAPEQIGEGNYTAARKFLKEEASFVKKNRAKIPAMAKEAEAELDGPGGAELLRAESEASGHAHLPGEG